MSSLHKRLTEQLMAQKGLSRDRAEQFARNLLIRQGSMDRTGKLTDHGKHREALGADGRAIERDSRGTKHKAEAYTYNPLTNHANLRRKRARKV